MSLRLHFRRWCFVISYHLMTGTVESRQTLVHLRIDRSNSTHRPDLRLEMTYAQSRVANLNVRKTRRYGLNRAK